MDFTAGRTEGGRDTSKTDTHLEAKRSWKGVISVPEDEITRAQRAGIDLQIHIVKVRIQPESELEVFQINNLIVSHILKERCL